MEQVEPTKKKIKVIKIPKNNNNEQNIKQDIKQDVRQDVKQDVKQDIKQDEPKNESVIIGQIEKSQMKMDYDMTSYHMTKIMAYIKEHYDIGKVVSVTIDTGTQTNELLLSLLYHGDDVMIDYCKKNNIDIEIVLVHVRMLYKELVKMYGNGKILDIDLYENIINKSLNNNNKKEVSNDIKELLKSKYDPKDGVIEFKYDHKDSKICKCLMCNETFMKDKKFIDKMQNMLTSDPYTNLLLFESLLYKELTTTYKDHIQFLSHKSINKINLLEYIQNNHSKEPTCTFKEFEEHFRSVLKKRITTKIDINNSNIYYLEKETKNEGKNNKYDVMTGLYINSTSHPDKYGISKYNIGKMCLINKDFMRTITNMLMGIEIASNTFDNIPDIWCCVDQYPYLKKPEMKTNEPSNYRLLTHHTVFHNQYHTYLAKNLHKYLVVNGYLDVNIQRAFMTNDGTWYGARDFYNTQNEFYQFKKDLFATFIDIKSAYITIDHDFIRFVMKVYNVPKNIANYFDKFYANLKVRVSYNGNTTEYLNMERGLLQGDHFSNVIFIMCIGYIMSILKKRHQNKSSVKKMFSVYVDDILSYANDPRLMKLIIEDLIKLLVELKTGLELNYDKCYFLMIGTTFKDVVKNGIVIRDTDNNKHLIRLLKDGEIIKYLGSYIDSSSEYDKTYFDHVYNEFLNEFKSVEKCLIEYKIFNSKSKTTDTINTKDTKNKHIIQIIYNYIVSKIQWKFIRLILPSDKMNQLVTRMDNLTNFYSKLWNVNYVPTTKYKNTILTSKNVLQLILASNNKNFIKSMDDMVIDIHKKTSVPVPANFGNLWMSLLGNHDYDGLS